MTANNDYISIPSASIEKLYPFKIGELITGTVLNKKSDGTYLILIGHSKYKVKYPDELDKKQLFKVLNNQDQLVLQLMTPKGQSKQSSRVIKQFKELNSSEVDDLLHDIVNNYLKYDIVLKEREITSLHRFIKQKYPGIDKKLLEFIIAMKAKGLKTSPANVNSWIDYDQTVGDLRKELIQLALKYNIAIPEDRQLMVLLSTLDTGYEIPEALYQCIAEVLSFIYSEDDKNRIRMDHRENKS